MIFRVKSQSIKAHLFKGKTILLLGPRQVGKTTLIREISKQYEGQIIWLNGDNASDRELLNAIDSKRAKELFPSGKLLVIDEAQRLINTGLTLKIIHDNCPEVQIIATGSSSFELSDKIKEAMTGRKWTHYLYPVSFEEISLHFGLIDSLRSLETRLIFGSYPDVINHAGQEEAILRELASDYLYKDVFTLKELRKPEALEKVVKALAFQVGSQVSYREVASLTGIDKETVERYIFLLEEAYIVFRLPSFSRNLRNELKRSKKIYFWDNGIRNAVIGQFAGLNLRNDIGALWENFLISERLKFNNYHDLYKNYYFWRTTAQQEIDFLEEYNGNLHAFEFKWNPKKKKKFSTTFLKAYPKSNTMVVDRNNFLDFVRPV